MVLCYEPHLSATLLQLEGRRDSTLHLSTGTSDEKTLLPVRYHITIAINTPVLRSVASDAWSVADYTV
jgi:hypothetical protein